MAGEIRGPAGAPVPPAAPSGPRVSPRPPARPTEWRYQPPSARVEPVNTSGPDAAVQLGRAALRRLAPAITAAAAVMRPVALNEGEDDWLDQQKAMFEQQRLVDRMSKLQDAPEEAPWLGEVRIAPGGETWSAVVLPGTDDIPVRPLFVPGRIDLPEPVAEPLYSPRPVARPATWREEKRVEKMDPERVSEAGRVTLLRLAVRPLDNPASEDGPVEVVKLRPRSIRERWVHVPRWRDSKYGKKLVQVVYRVVNHSYGTVSEVQDAIDVLGQNIYGLTDRGQVVQAMVIEGGDLSRVLRGLASGKYKVDGVGFAVDYARQQLSDLAYAAEGAPREMAVAAGGRFTWQAQYATNEGVKMGESDVSSSIRAASSWLRSQDVQRARRVSELFS